MDQEGDYFYPCFKAAITFKKPEKQLFIVSLYKVMAGVRDHPHILLETAVEKWGQHFFYLLNPKR